MSRLRYKQHQQGKLAPQQVTLLKFLQVPGDNLYKHVEDAIADNPALELASQDTTTRGKETDVAWEAMSAPSSYGRPRYSYKESWDDLLQRKPLADRLSLHEELLDELHGLRIEGHYLRIAEHLVGSLDSYGYLKRSLEVLVDEMALQHGITVTLQQVAEVLTHIQALDPPGIGARNLQECLQLQLARKATSPTVLLARRILAEAFVPFSKKQYLKVATTLHIEDHAVLRQALALITTLHPRPVARTHSTAVLGTMRQPDFIIAGRGDSLTARLRDDYLPPVRLAPSYALLAKESDSQTASFVKEKVQRAKWFLQALKQGQETLLRTMNTIVQLQAPFFAAGEEHLLKPLYLRQVAEVMGMDISTISRVVRGRVVQTDWGPYPLKYFFSEPIRTTGGGVVSSRVIKQAIATAIEEEDKQAPFTDNQLAITLHQQGYLVARRTVAKYREQLRLPIARLRKGF